MQKYIFRGKEAGGGVRFHLGIDKLRFVLALGQRQLHALKCFPLFRPGSFWQTQPFYDHIFQEIVKHLWNKNSLGFIISGTDPLLQEPHCLFVIVIAFVILIVIIFPLFHLTSFNDKNLIVVSKESPTKRNDLWIHPMFHLHDDVDD